MRDLYASQKAERPSKYDPQYLRHYFQNKPNLGPTWNLRKLNPDLMHLMKTGLYNKIGNGHDCQQEIQIQSL